MEVSIEEWKVRWISRPKIYWILQEGINRHLNVKKNQQQNGIAERMNMTLIERVRCMWLQAKLSESFGRILLIMLCTWLIDFHQRYSNPNVSNKSGQAKTSTILIWKFFECRKYDYISSDERKKLKLKLKSLEYIFLSFKKGFKGYELREPKKVLNRDVILNERLGVKDVGRKELHEKNHTKVSLSKERSFSKNHAEME